MGKRVWFLLMLVFECLFVVAQDNLEDINFSSMIFGIDYMSNRKVNGKVNVYSSQPTLTIYSGYLHKSGLDLTFMASSVSNSDESSTQATQEYNLSVGYNADITNWLNMSAMYSHSFYSTNSYALGSSYSDLFNFGVYNTIKSFNVDLDLGYYFGDTKEFISSLELSYSFELEDVFVKNHLLSIEPSFSIYTGDINYILDYAYNNYYFLNRYSENHPEDTVDDLLNRIKKRPNAIGENLERRIIEIEKLPRDVVISELFEVQHKYGISSIGFSLPIYYQWGDFMFSAGVSFTKPINQSDYINDSWINYNNIGVIYYISWD